MTKPAIIQFEDVHSFVDSVFGEDVHAKRVYSMANASLGIMSSASMAIHAIGQGLAEARGLATKHTIKQVDRLLSNKGIQVWHFFSKWVPHVVGSRKEVMVALDWTNFDADGHTTLALNLVTRHGRATPLLWLTVQQSKLKNNQADHEDRLLRRLNETVPDDVMVTILADRGFGNTRLFALMDELGFDYVIRLRGNIHVTDKKGVTADAKDWVGTGGRAKLLRGATVTEKHFPVPTVVCVQAKDMKEPWCLCASDPKATSRPLIKFYAKRWSIEPCFRDIKDWRFGKGLAHVHIRDTKRRDRMLLMSAMASVLLTLLGSAGESLGMDRLLKANTVKKRTHSLFRQGCMWYQLIPNMPVERLHPLMQEFGRLLQQQAATRAVFGDI